MSRRASTVTSPRRYQELGQKCPIAVVVGMHPALFMVAGRKFPTARIRRGRRLLGEPVEVIKAGDRPIPANAEIARKVLFRSTT
jgi:UbiD family decarboxylase